MENALCQENHTQLNSPVSAAEHEVQPRPKHPEGMGSLGEGRRLLANQRNRESYRRRHPNWRTRRENHTPITREFILSNVQVDPNTGCWNWTRATSKGYGRVWDGNRFIQTQRAAFELWIGPLGEGLFACHKCDNRKCCNPEHLFQGNQFDNMRDSARKGRIESRLTAEQVIKIRNDPRSSSKIARDYPIGRTGVDAVKNRIIYAWV